MVMARIVMAYRGRAYIVMAHIAMACTCSTRMPDVFARTVKGTEKDNEVINSLDILWGHDPRSESNTASCQPNQHGASTGKEYAREPARFRVRVSRGCAKHAGGQAGARDRRACVCACVCLCVLNIRSSERARTNTFF